MNLIKQKPIHTILIGLFISYCLLNYYIDLKFEKRNLSRSWSGFEEAAYDGRIEDLKFYIKNGFSPSYLSLYWLGYHHRILRHVVSKGQCEVLKLLVDSGARNLDIRDSNGDRPLIILAAEYAKPVCVKVLLEAGVDPNSPGAGYIEGGEGRSITPLYEAAFGTYLRKDSEIDRTETVKLLLEHGADVNVIDPFVRDNALDSPALNGRIQILQMLLKYGANPNQVDRYGDVPIFSAIRGKSENRYKSVNLLVKYGANINYINKDDTPLIISVKNKDKKMIQLLFDLGADKNLQNKNGKKAIDFAKTKEIRDMLQ
jgi:ankyrin repeat protein